MDKLQPQTVYVPVDKPEFDRSTTPKGNYNVVDNVTYEIVAYAHKLPGVYPLTGKELHDLIAGWDYRVHTTIKDYLQSKGIEI